MSIINQTLRDLDARAPVTATAVEGAAPITVPALRRSRLKTGIVLGVLLAIAGLAIGLVLKPAAVTETDRVAPVPAPGPGSVAVSEAATPVPPAVAAREPLPVALDATLAAAAVEQVSQETTQATARSAHAEAASSPLRPAADAQPVKRESLKLDTHIARPRETRAASISRELTKSTPEEEAEDRYRKALTLLNKGRDNQARLLLEETLRTAPGHVAARQVLATLLNENGLNREAEVMLREGQRVNPDHPWFALSLARLQASRGDLDEAAASLRSGIDGRGVTADYHATYAAILSRLKRHPEAASQYEQALLLQPGQGSWWMGLGLALSAQGKSSEARAAYGRALQAGNLSGNLEDFVRAKLSE